jgi:hypothetical protein
MNYWIIALPREDMEHCIKIGTGFNPSLRMTLFVNVCEGATTMLSPV